jgi:hypothetical protein
VAIRRAPLPVRGDPWPNSHQPAITGGIAAIDSGEETTRHLTAQPASRPGTDDFRASEALTTGHRRRGHATAAARNILSISVRRRVAVQTGLAVPKARISAGPIKINPTISPHDGRRQLVPFPHHRPEPTADSAIGPDHRKGGAFRPASLQLREAGGPLLGLT